MCSSDLVLRVVPIPIHPLSLDEVPDSIVAWAARKVHTKGVPRPAAGAPLCQSDVVAELPEQIVHVVVHEAVIGDKLVFDLPQKLFVLHVVGRLDGGEVLVVVAGWHRVHLSFYL